MTDETNPVLAMVAEIKEHDIARRGRASYEWLCAQVERDQASIAELSAMLATPSGGHDKPCVYCGEKCNSLAGNPSRWPMFLDPNGSVGCRGCVLRRLREHSRIAELEAEVAKLRAERSEDDPDYRVGWSDAIDAATEFMEEASKTPGRYTWGRLKALVHAMRAHPLRQGHDTLPPASPSPQQAPEAAAYLRVGDYQEPAPWCRDAWFVLSTYGDGPGTSLHHGWAALCGAAIAVHYFQPDDDQRGEVLACLTDWEIWDTGADGYPWRLCLTYEDGNVAIERITDVGALTAEREAGRLAGIAECVGIVQREEAERVLQAQMTPRELAAQGMDVGEKAWLERQHYLHGYRHALRDLRQALAAKPLPQPEKEG